jgi:hypothetical protein
MDPVDDFVNMEYELAGDICALVDAAMAALKKVSAYCLSVFITIFHHAVLLLSHWGSISISLIMHFSILTFLLKGAVRLWSVDPRNPERRHRAAVGTGPWRLAPRLGPWPREASGLVTRLGDQAHQPGQVEGVPQQRGQRGPALCAPVPRRPVQPRDLHQRSAPANGTQARHRHRPREDGLQLGQGPSSPGFRLPTGVHAVQSPAAGGGFPPLQWAAGVCPGGRRDVNGAPSVHRIRPGLLGGHLPRGFFGGHSDLFVPEPRRCADRAADAHPLRRSRQVGAVRRSLVPQWRRRINRLQ